MKNRIDQRRLRHQRLRQKVKGTAARPRMAIAMSNKNITVQFIDDDAANTLASYSTVGTDAKLNIATAKDAGAKAAEAALAVKELVEAAVAAGIRISAKNAEESK